MVRTSENHDLLFQIAVKDLGFDDQRYYDTEKKTGRKLLLSQYPEKRIHLNTQTLKQIIPYTHFMCYPYSSVTEGLSIDGSDIDGAIVVAEEKTTLQQE